MTLSYLYLQNLQNNMLCLCQVLVTHVNVVNLFKFHKQKCQGGLGVGLVSAVEATGIMAYLAGKLPAGKTNRFS